MLKANAAAQDTVHQEELRRVQLEKERLHADTLRLQQEQRQQQLEQQEKDKKQQEKAQQQQEEEQTLSNTRDNSRSKHSRKAPSTPGVRLPPQPSTPIPSVKQSILFFFFLFQVCATKIFSVAYCYNSR